MTHQETSRVAHASEALRRALRDLATCGEVTAEDRAALGIAMAQVAAVRDRHQAAPRACTLPERRAGLCSMVRPDEREMLLGPGDRRAA